MIHQWTTFLERRWIAPAYAGWVVLAMAICFFGAATNTMTGWLYVLSAIGLVLAAVAAILPSRSLRALSVEHLPIAPITAGEELCIGFRLHNHSSHPQILFQLYDLLPPELGFVRPLAIERVPAHGTYETYLTCTPPQRGFYSWAQLELRSAQPLGLFWSRRSQSAPVQAWVYPQRLPLAHCPLLENVRDPRGVDRHSAQLSTRPDLWGITRSLRPYRSGDPLRLVHWRSSARYGDLQVRELENSAATTVITLALDTAGNWEPIAFEQAVIAATSLYFYGLWRQMEIQFWSAQQGVVVGQQAILRALTQIQPAMGNGPRPTQPLLWIAADGSGLADLPQGSRCLLWNTSQSSVPGLSIDPHQPLAPQLQQSLSFPGHG
jgi:uncharacterized protein (DUF58 family)